MSAASGNREGGMARDVLAIPLGELRQHFALNSRQDIKVVAPELLGDRLAELLRKKGKHLKPEVELAGETWTHSGSPEPNGLCLSADFVCPTQPGATTGTFALAFANGHAPQEAHFHRRHSEIYFSEHPFEAEFWTPAAPVRRTIRLPEGGALVFGPGVVHRMRLEGLTVVLEVPAVPDDKFGVVQPDADGPEGPQDRV
jgi:hypothetical protein